jgi:NADPH:quinone reductase-like Zn-dependent oxidoreductase
MKAVQMHGYGGVDQLRYEDIPDPKPGADDVLVKVGATSVNPIDWKIRRGDLKDMIPLRFPVILGRDVAGEVVETGRNVTNFKPGQRVMGLVNRSYAELLTAGSDVLTLIPDGLDNKQAGSMPLVTTTGAQLVDQIRPGRGDTILVTGAYGNVGRTAVYEAKQRGARVIAAVLFTQKDDARSLGADQIAATDRDDEIESLPTLDAIADTVGGHLIGKLIPKLRQGGVLGSVVVKPKSVDGRDIRVEAVVSHPDRALLHRLAEAVRSRALVIPIARQFSLSEARDAQRLSERGTIDGKIVLVP